MRPFLKWAGGKYKLVDRIKGMLPEGDVLVEAFTGGASVFLNTDYSFYWLIDTNHDLINLYKHTKRNIDDLIHLSRGYFIPQFNQKHTYYAMRERFNALPMGIERAALFIYLNRHGFNGLCRYNQKGKYNVPFGQYKRPYLPEEEMRFFSQKAKKAEFYCMSYSTIMWHLTRGHGHVVYADPPYVPLSDTANFTEYSSGKFTLEDQEALLRHAVSCERRGVPVLISNHDTPYTRELYKEADEIEFFKVRRNISCNGETRGYAPELLALYK